MESSTSLAAFGAAVRRGRQRLGFSQEEFAHVVGMHRTQLGHIEQGRKDCRLTTIKRLAQALGTEASALLRDAERHRGS